MHDTQDTIAAIATAPGAAGLAVVRLSGPRALAVADAVFEGGARLADAPGQTLHHGWVVSPGGRSSADAAPGGRAAGDAAPRAHAPGGGTSGARAPGEGPAGDRAVLDEVVAAVFRAPRSYTREDVVELSCHGGLLPAGRVLAALLAAGARLARPGEFTLRAFLNGRVDLAQAEAVADLVQAETTAAHALALSQLRGELSRRLAAVAESLREAAAEVEARVDFAEDVGGGEVPGHVVEAVAAAEAALRALLAGAAYARAVREGVRVAIVGRPNAGKSSLFNALLGERRAIVASAPGTTRDLVSESLEVAGVRVTLADTAGLHEGSDEVEGEGVARARAALEESAVALWVVDASAPLTAEDRWIAARLVGRRALVALNKCDLPGVVGSRDVESLLGSCEVEGSAVPGLSSAAAPGLTGAACRVVAVSATRGDGVGDLLEALSALLGAGGPREAEAWRGRAGGPHAAGLTGAVANPRHVEALERARAALVRARESAATGAPGEIVALELRESLAAIGEVTGEAVGEDLLERIFARFCIGK